MPFDAYLFDSDPVAYVESMSCFTTAFISANAAIFLTNDWIKTDNLKLWLITRDTSVDRVLPSLTRSKFKPSRPPLVKLEPRDYQSSVPASADTKVKSEPTEPRIHHAAQQPQHEVIEIFDSDEELAFQGEANGKRREKEGYREPQRQSSPPPDLYTLPFNPLEFDTISDTAWEDSEVTSYVIEKTFAVAKGFLVERVEYLNQLPALWPIPEQPTAFILDLRDPKYNLYDKDGDLYRVDALVKNKDQDSFRTTTGTSDSQVMVTFQAGHTPIQCRRARAKCNGCFACAEVDPKLLDVERFELDPAPRAKIFAAQQETRTNEEMGSKEQKAATFLSIIRSGSCKAKDSTDKICNGRPCMRPKPNGISRGHTYFIACSGWRRNFMTGHKVLQIPDDVDEDILALLMNDGTLSKECDTSPCSRVVSPHIGGKLKYCTHMHIVDGKTGTRSPIVHRKCPALRRMYVPVDEKFRFLLLVNPGPIAHNHPIPPMCKASFEAKVAYKGCIEAAGTAGITVQKVDNANSTRLILGGKTPGEFNAALMNKRVKRDIVHAVKVKKNPAGLGVPGVYELFRKEFSEPPDSRYIHEIITTDTGKLLIFTAVPYLLSLIHDVPSFECDTTFKRVKDSGINEWEMVIYYPPVQRAVTVARVYLDCADMSHYEQLFDNLQKLIKTITGKALAFKRFSTDGNLLCMNADMEAAQVLGAARSILKSVDFQFSGLPPDISPEELAAYFVRLCLTHTKRGILDFRAAVPNLDYQRLMDFPYLTSIEELESFSDFVKALKVKKIQDWWDHKYSSKWIIPCILKSQSKINQEDFHRLPSTTNIGEGQHHWTNEQSGIKLSLVDAILTAREIDERVGREIHESLDSGIRTNSQTDLLHRMSRQSQRQSATARKAYETRETEGAVADIQEQIEEEKENQRLAASRKKELKEKLKELKGAGPVSNRRKKKPRVTNTPHAKPTDAVFHSSSSGRVKTPSLPTPSKLVPSKLLPTPSELAPTQASEDSSYIAGFTHAVEPYVAQFVEGSSTGQYSGWEPYAFQSLSYLNINTENLNHTSWNSDHSINDGMNLYAENHTSWNSGHPIDDGMNLSGILSDYDGAQIFGPDNWYSYDNYTNEEPYQHPDTLLPPFPPPSPPPMSSSPGPAPSSPTPSSPTVGTIPPLDLVGHVDTKGKKRARDEVDVHDILPAGSRRTAHRPTRVPVLVASMNGNQR
ncbi:hypothetical protein HYPSUDRAFT_80527 [Hypholoma sublateritium FD-334 SS-4]|uniref:Uncharacterized protein n=1 Tax=Hypholoma sublateritium (strain FD-334 SS-4) TaxID=945553 RepID=A0A0D2N8J6_HYPSF|nr:hypothetical protein HYPSUDRAFT_80527 [Hypholoma sublateritium FD-334 SS-4]